MDSTVISLLHCMESLMMSVRVWFADNDCACVVCVQCIASHSCTRCTTTLCKWCTSQTVKPASVLRRQYQFVCWVVNRAIFIDVDCVNYMLHFIRRKNSENSSHWNQSVWLVKKSRLRWFGYVERKDDKTGSNVVWRQKLKEFDREDAQERCGGIVLRMTWKL